MKLKPRVKAYLELAPVLFDFVYRSRIWFAINSDPSTCFLALCIRLDGLGFSLRKRKKFILFGKNDRN